MKRSIAWAFSWILKKAFDVCSHNILLQKLLLPKFGRYRYVRKSLCKRLVFIHEKIQHFRSSRVVYSGQYYSSYIFMIIYSNLCLQMTPTVRLASHNIIIDLISTVNNETKKIAGWFRANEMGVKVGKTKYILFQTKGKRIDPGSIYLILYMTTMN